MIIIRELGSCVKVLMASVDTKQHWTDNNISHLCSTLACTSSSLFTVTFTIQHTQSSLHITCSSYTLIRAKLEKKVRFGQYAFFAQLVHCLKMIWGCMFECIHWHSTEWSVMLIYVNVVHTSSSFHTHTFSLIPFEDCEPTGLKVDVARVSMLI